MSHIDDGVLHIYLDGELPSIDPSEAEAVEGHLRACAGCRNRLEQARQVRTQAHALLGRSGPAVVREPAFEVLVSRTAERPPRPSTGPERWRVSAWAASVLLALAVGWYASGRISDGERLGGTAVPLEVASVRPEVEISPEAEALPGGERVAPSAAAREEVVAGAPVERFPSRAAPRSTEVLSAPDEVAAGVATTAPAARETSGMSTAAASAGGRSGTRETRAPAEMRTARLRSGSLAAAPDVARVDAAPGVADRPTPPTSAAEGTADAVAARRVREEPAAYAAAPAAAPALPAPPAPPPADARTDAIERPEKVGVVEQVRTRRSDGLTVARGRVVDEQGRGLANAQVFARVDGATVGTLTAEDGSYTLEVPSTTGESRGTVPLRVALIGYGSDTARLALAPGAVVRRDFSLREDALALEELVVTGTAATLETAPSLEEASRWLSGTRWTGATRLRAERWLDDRVRTLPGARLTRVEVGEVERERAVRSVQRLPDGTEIEVLQRRVAFRGHRLPITLQVAPRPEAEARQTGAAVPVVVMRGDWVYVLRGPLAPETLRGLAERIR